MKAFSVLGSALSDWWNAWVGLTALSLGWLVCTATVLLAPPALFTLCQAAHSTVRGESFAVRDLLLWLKRYFWKSWLWAIANAALLFGLWLNFRYYGQFQSVWAASFLALTALLGAFWVTAQFYALPYLMAQEKPSLRQAWRNAFLTVVASPLYSAVLVGVAGILLYGSVRLPVLLFVGVPSFVAVLGVHAVKERLEHFGVRR